MEMETGTCQVCFKDLNSLEERARLDHINDWLDEKIEPLQNKIEKYLRPEKEESSEEEPDGRELEDPTNVPEYESMSVK